MFPVPKKYRAPQRPAVWPRWRPYKGKSTSCDDCIMAIANGTRTFASQPAGQTREDANGKAYYCNAHAIDRKMKDEAQ